MNRLNGRSIGNNHRPIFFAEKKFVLTGCPRHRSRLSDRLAIGTNDASPLAGGKIEQVVGSGCRRLKTRLPLLGVVKPQHISRFRKSSTKKAFGY